ncbi:MAG TPA: PAS domain S-box protein [bacterium]|mgnify:FL=1|nr:PAS domain S-box protein [bacterium]
MARTKQMVSQRVGLRPDPPTSSRRIHLKLIRIPLLYLLLSAAWILLSDHLFIRGTPEIANYAYYQTFKGLLFVAVSSVILYWLAYTLFKEIRHTNRLLEENHRFLAGQLSNLPGTAYRCRNEPGWPMIYLSEGCSVLTGYPPDGLIQGDPVTYEQLIHPSDRMMVWNTIQEAIREQRPYQLEYRIRTASGEEKWVWEKGKAVYDPQGKVQYLEGFISDISERKRAEATLQESEYRYRTIIENTSDCVWRITLEGIITFISPSVKTILDYEPEEITGQSIFTIMPPGIQPRVRQRLDRLGQGKLRREELVLELPFLRKDGGIRIGEVRAVLIYNPHGHPVEVAGIAHDITQRKQAEAALRQSQEQIDKAQEVARIGFWNTDLQTGRLIWSKGVYRIFGMEEDQFDNQRETFYAHVHPEDRELIIEALHQAVETQSAYQIEHRILLPGGAVRWVSEQAEVVRDSEGRPVQMIGTVQDITSRKLVENELRNSKQRLETLIQASPVAVIVLDLHQRVILWNKAAEGMFGWTESEILNQPCPIIPEGQQDQFQRFFNNALWGIPVRNQETWLRRKDEAPIYVNLSTAPLWDNRGQAEGVMAILVDITEQKKSVEERIKLEQQLQQSQKMEAIGKLAGGIAHDFNNLLMVIEGYSEMALTRLNPHEAVRKDFEEIRQAAGRAKMITRQLLAFSRKQMIQPVVLNINQVVSDFEKILRRLIGEDIQVITRLDPQVGTIKADPTQIEQVIANLAINARDAMPHGGKLILETANRDLDESYTQHFVGLKPGSYVMLAVTDTGCGMDAETISHIFEPFFTTKTESGGTGLGLSTVYGITKQNEGHIHVYSEPGKGSTFKIYFPRIEAESGETGILPREYTLPAGSETILIVEDEAPVRQLTVRILQGCGYRVLEAASCEEALATSRSLPEPIHLLLTDVVMPVMSGRRLAAQLALERPGLKVLYMSGYTDDAVVQHGILESETAFLQKPFTPAALAQKIRAVLDTD